MKIDRLLLHLWPTAFLLCGVIGCGESPRTMSTVTASANGRDVTVKSDRMTWTQNDDKAIVVKVPGNDLAIQTDRILLNDKPVAEIPSAARRFEVKIAGTDLTIAADGTQVVSMTLPR
jgi:hypothetical protein